MDVHINTEGGEGRRDAIYRQLRDAILIGRLAAGVALPPTRELAARLAVSRNTVSAAYDRLIGEGYVEGRTGSGTFVRAGARATPLVRTPVTGPAGVRPSTFWDTVAEAPVLDRRRFDFDFRTGLPDVSTFPLATWRRLLAAEHRHTDPAGLLYGDPAGHGPLREEIARHVGIARGVVTEPSGVLVTNGAQQAVDLLARVLLGPGERVAVEDPGYPPARSAFAALAGNTVGVPVDAEGIVVDALPANARLVYVTPAHQFPLGVPMSLRRRLELLDWAGRRDAVVVEDDYDSEFRYTGRPLEPLHSLDSAGRVCYVGTFSKVLFPALRLGYLIPPPSLLSALTKARHLADWQPPGPQQAALAAFIGGGGLARHVRTMRQEYRRRRDLVSRVLADEFADVCEPVPVSAGLHASAFLECGTADFARRARRAGVGIHALEEFATEPGRDGLVLGYGAIAYAAIEPGLRRLRELVDRERASPGRAL